MEELLCQKPQETLNDSKVKTIIKKQEFYDSSVYKKTYFFVKQYILKNSGNFYDFEDILQDGFCIFLRKVQSKSFILSTKPEYYIYRICVKLWLKELEKRRRAKIFLHDGTKDSGMMCPNEQDFLRKERLLRIIENNIKHLPEKCQQFFQFKKEGLTLDQIARKMGFKNQHVSKDKGFRCKKRLLELIEEDEDFLLLMREERE